VTGAVGSSCLDMGDFPPPTLESLPDAVARNMALARPRTCSRIMAGVKADGTVTGPGLDGQTTVTGVVLGQPGPNQIAAGLASPDPSSAARRRSSGCAGSAPANPDTTTCAPKPPMTAARPRTPTVRVSQGCSADPHARLGAGVNAITTGLGDAMSRTLRPLAVLEKTVKFAECMRQRRQRVPGPDASGNPTHRLVAAIYEFAGRGAGGRVLRSCSRSTH
jgi:hypothetical protein